ncbi:hypothetical protein EES39_05060 [Streptomyces sp. ADI92-24]|uniref:hypothetical protein n=1 Tax=unclassified Streptomyces TaxID=2593676 RepID=UPI000F4A4580|nr:MULTISPECIES: hypothetical protein [unclassified Streptomyces]MCX4772500.1 hypothetical protein [Streptomyces sp. NBC_01285]ROQ71528.1 hypothetical protein EDD95_7644 [Streptomyces sp. CEV 2-1]RPK50952.1 hypothetical protein EES39_05060 [Streptomyces sp. ADI92-24]
MAIPRPRTSQFEAFTTNIAYARKMVDAGRYLAPFQPGAVDVDDFYRAAWVQAVAAIDHWFHEELFCRVADLAARDSPDMPLQLRNYEIPLHRVEAVQRGDVTLPEVVVEHVKEKWGNASLQHVDAISKALKLVTEKNIWLGAAMQINTWQGGRTAYTDKTLRAQFAGITTRRNKIAHDADLVAGDLKQRRPISEPDVTDAINWIDRIALAVAHVLDE